jgi:hypothetical protein
MPALGAGIHAFVVVNAKQDEDGRTSLGYDAATLAMTAHN